MVAGDPGEMCCSVGCENISVEPRTRALRNKMGKRARKKLASLSGLQPAVEQSRRELSAAPNICLLIYLIKVFIDRFYAYSQPLRDFEVLIALEALARHLSLSFRQSPRLSQMLFIA